MKMTTQEIIELNNSMQTDRDEARSSANRWKADAERFAEQRNAARAEVERLKQARHDARLENSGQAAQLERTRPEPSRLEIAVQFLTHNEIAVETALQWADALIEAAKETK
jgi:hypothetical protein